MLISALHLLRTHREPSRETIRAEMSGNICRCTGYAGIVDAIQAAAHPCSRESGLSAH
ncbi:MAG TPA: 2Fe-2S iron-sulfur cluster-binding protein [Pseudonocardia sp.]